ncbi:hypothetical protein B0H15DRAFT_956200 [Mycena belliarum]|uniref:Uncharacterized protein n=1 Tax=Mycena belliarum TaxID=1033014 RepID=A0AAD6TPN1_9AGAR|nr:hypothetical protein B0H15DRAFT_956200 [Mycena belliae]
MATALPPATRPATFTIPRHTTAILLPFRFHEKIATELVTIRGREENEPYYRGETNVPPTNDSDSDSDSDSQAGSDVLEGEASAPSSSPNTSPRSSSPAAISSQSITSSPEPKPPVDLEPAVDLDNSESSPLLRRYGFERVVPERRNIVLRPRLAPRPSVMDGTAEPVSLTRQQMRALGYRPFSWDRQPAPFIDRDRLVGAVMIGAPAEEPLWETQIQLATAAMAQAERFLDMGVLTDDCLREGVRPQNILLTLENQVEAARLALDPGIQTVVRFQSQAYQHFFPDMFTESQDTIEDVRWHDRSLHLPFDRTASLLEPAFTSVEYRFGAALSPPRSDDLAAVNGMTALTVVGDHDTRFGGDIIFLGAKVYAPFPPGATFVFPAWWMPYSFTRVDPDEHLYVITQRMDAGIYRYAENGMRSEHEFERYATDEERRIRAIYKESQAGHIVGMLKKLDDFEVNE